ncbi:phytosulfokine receptor 1 isoform X4 [Salvia hispanica]|uniref:phytosulfokine receptor 1 isoform X4 n=1 Tax=Salvia hispanica TaxID=49212 RepID=UPI0020098DC6|nr:phytosulfokine receptor 1 isoform X4 [Salvia hispanica]
MTVFILFMILTFLGFSSRAQNFTCNSNDLEALRAFMHSLDSPIEGWDFNSSSSNCCDWPGITCSSPQSRVIKLELGAKRFFGNLSESLANLEQLKTLNLSRNYLKGSIPLSLLHLPQLEILDLSYNLISGTFPGSINLPSIRVINVSENSIGGALPAEICSNSTRIRVFNAVDNFLTGVVPLGLGNCTSLEELGLATNLIHGALPEDLYRLQKLSKLFLQENNLSGQLSRLIGEIPQSFKNFQSLTSLSLSNTTITNLTTALDVLQHCRNLTTLVLTLNFRGEMMPANPSFEFLRLKTLVIANCRLTGGIPQWLSRSRDLQLLDLSWNRMGGSIPPWFGNLSSLFYLDLSNNSFTGNLPKELTEMQSLISGNVSMVEPSPDFPLFVRKNQYGLKYKRAMSFPPTLELGNNFLTGPIWLEFGNLKRLQVLDLKCNNLSGSIPSTLSLLTGLETLDLSFNELSGTIPGSLSNLTFLSFFSVAHNALSGTIPSGNQFATFPNSSFEGNPDLCGDHGLPPCRSNNNVPRLSTHKSKKARSVAIAVGVGIGAGTIILAALVYLIVLCSCKRKVVDPENEDADATEKNLAEISSLVILCQNKESKEIILDDLLTSTDDFDQANIIGCGGFGLVYKAVLPDGRKVAIKRLSGEYFQIEREFQAEIETLSRAQHPNLVQLQGYCKYKNDRLLIYKYMENGSLDYWLHEKTDGPSSLDWEKRLQIARGAARGLAYLHQSCDPRILHRDIKSSNILLDEEFEAHLADFGLARLILPYDTHVTTDLVGTLGYIPPEYGQASVATYKGDIYSFGVVLLELLTGKRPMDMCRPKAYRDMISWVIRMKRLGREVEVLDPFVYDKQNTQVMLTVLEIACLCLRENPKARPCTLQLVTWLDNINSVSILHPS